jgi:hypothetical protein
MAGALSADRWEIRFSYPEDTMIPDLGKLGEVFAEGEAALRGIIGATSSFRNLHDLPKIKEAVGPHIEPVAEAVEAVKGIAKAPSKGVSFGLSLGSPKPLPGQSGMPRGLEGRLILTLRF